MQFKNKAQGWGFDLMVASIIFITGLVVFYLYSLNSPTETQEVLNVLTYDGNLIANAFLSEGYPLDWNENNVISLGIMSNNRINQTKLERFYALSTSNYQKTKELFNTKYEYYIFSSENFTIAGQEVSGIGNFPLNPKNLIKISRITIYNNKPIDLNFEIWE